MYYQIEMPKSSESCPNKLAYTFKSIPSFKLYLVYIEMYKNFICEIIQLGKYVFNFSLK